MSHIVAFASSVTTLEDYFKSEVCSGRTIYCQFQIESLGYLGEHFVKDAISKNKVREVIFSDGLVIKSS